METSFSCANAEANCIQSLLNQFDFFEDEDFTIRIGEFNTRFSFDNVTEEEEFITKCFNQ